jgi:hypothetical protein
LSCLRHRFAGAETPPDILENNKIPKSRQNESFGLAFGICPAKKTFSVACVSKN